MVTVFTVSTEPTDSMTSQVIDFRRRLRHASTMVATTRSGATSGLLLSRAVRANVGFSPLSGGTLLLGASWLTDLLGPPGWALAVVGGGVAFGLSL